MTTILNAVKTCRTCATPKPLSDFHRRTVSADGHTSSCKDCVRTHNRANKDKLAAYRRTHYAANRDKLKARSHASRNKLQRQTRLNGHAVGSPWTAEDDALLMADDGLTVEQKALNLGRTYASCIARRTRIRKNTP